MFCKTLLTLTAVALSVPAQAQIIEGRASAIDGDTLDMTGTRIRLAYIDAPETKQTCLRDGIEWSCGAEATADLASIIEGQSVSCKVIDKDVYARRVAICHTRIFNIGRELARRGMAITLDNAPPEYDEASSIARRIASGLWASTFQAPSEWRAANPQEAPRFARSEPQGQVQRSPSSPAEHVYRDRHGCTIKGNRSRRGDWIYHLPGRPYYEETRAEEMFCTESEAVAAGYRRSRA